jgi:hypothetical protein
MIVALLYTVRGMMYYRKALELQAFLDMAKDDGISNSESYLLIDVAILTHTWLLSLLFFSFRSYGRLQSNWTDVWGLKINDSVQSYSWLEIYLCCLMSTIWSTKTFRRYLCTWYFEIDDNVSIIFCSNLQAAATLRTRAAAMLSRAAAEVVPGKERGAGRWRGKGPRR